MNTIFTDSLACAAIANVAHRVESSYVKTAGSKRVMAVIPFLR
jgi:hypothetical protein